MYTQIKVAKLVMNLNLVLPGLTGRLVLRRDTLALYLDMVDLISGHEVVCLRQYDEFSYCQPIILPAVGSLLRQYTVNCRLSRHGVFESH